MAQTTRTGRDTPDAVLASSAWTSQTGFLMRWCNRILPVVPDYSLGYGDGSAYGFQKAIGAAPGYGDAYDDGQDDGLVGGFSSGYATGQATLLSVNSPLYIYIYTGAFGDGFTAGTTYGVSIGLQRGASDGYESGYDAGLSDGVGDGFASAASGGGGDITSPSITVNSVPTLTTDPLVVTFYDATSLAFYHVTCRDHADGPRYTVFDPVDGEFLYPFDNDRSTKTGAGTQASPYVLTIYRLGGWPTNLSMDLRIRAIDKGGNVTEA